MNTGHCAHQLSNAVASVTMPRTHQDTNSELLGRCTVLSANVAHLLVSGHAAVLSVTLTVPCSSIEKHFLTHHPSEYRQNRSFVSSSEAVSDGSNMEVGTCAIIDTVIIKDWQPVRCQSKCDQPRPYSLDKWLRPQNELFLNWVI